MGESESPAGYPGRHALGGLLRHAARELFAQDPGVFSVGIGTGKLGYELVALRQQNKARQSLSWLQALDLSTATSFDTPTHVEGIPVRTFHARSIPSSLGSAGAAPGATPPEQTTQRPLVCGLRIQNVDHDQRLGKLAEGRKTNGTLGCFVHLPDGRLALLSNNHVIAGENQGRRNQDRILQQANLSFDPALHVATLTDFVDLEFSSISDTYDTAKLNTVDAAIAALEPGLVPYQQFHASRRLPPTTGWGDAHNGDPVFMVGAQSGHRRGTVTQEIVITTIDYGPHMCWFEDSMVIESADGRPFAVHGDSGAIVVRESDSAVVGLVYAASETQAWACPIRSALDALGTRLA